jgi:hypothetical protein
VEIRPRAINEYEAAKYLGRSVVTLRNWRHLRRGPAYVKTGKAVSYLMDDLEAYLIANRIDPEDRR